MVRLIEVRQPRQHDLVSGTFTLAGFGTGFEATVSWRVLEGDGDVLGSLQRGLGLALGGDGHAALGTAGEVAGRPAGGAAGQLPVDQGGDRLLRQVALRDGHP